MKKILILCDGVWERERGRERKRGGEGGGEGGGVGGGVGGGEGGREKRTSGSSSKNTFNSFVSVAVVVRADVVEKKER